jgi:chitinase
MYAGAMGERTERALWGRRFIGGVAVGLLALLAMLAGPGAVALAQPVEMAAPYEYLGWGDPQAPATVMADTGVGDLTMAFILSKKTCNPEWDGERPLLGGRDQAAIESIRAAGGEVDVSFGGWSGKKLGSSCKTVAALRGAYQKVIDTYGLHAIDIDIEHGEFTNKKTRVRVVEALAATEAANPGLEISITMGTAEAGPEKDGLSLIADAAAIGFQPSAWTAMPFDFGPARTDMGHASIRSLEGLAHDVAAAYKISLASAYEHSGVSSMNGETDESSETVSLEDFQTIVEFARQVNLARVTFWAVNRDRPCQAKGAPEEECSGIAQSPFAFTDMVAGYHG